VRSAELPRTQQQRAAARISVQTVQEEHTHKATPRLQPLGFRVAMRMLDAETSPLPLSVCGVLLLRFRCALGLDLTAASLPGERRWRLAKCTVCPESGAEAVGGKGTTGEATSRVMRAHLKHDHRPLERGECRHTERAEGAAHSATSALTGRRTTGWHGCTGRHLVMFADVCVCGEWAA
jgi:hypothetical protein